MRLFVNLKREAVEYSAAPQRKIKHMKGPILCLFPSEVENAALEACENQKNIAENFLANMIKENKLADEKSDRKNCIVEKVIDENLGPIIHTITDEFHQSIRNHFSMQIYRQIKQSRKLVVDDDVQSLRDISTTFNVENFVQRTRVTEQKKVRKAYINLNFFLLPHFRQAKQLESRRTEKIQTLKSTWKLC